MLQALPLDIIRFIAHLVVFGRGTPSVRSYDEGVLFASTCTSLRDALATGDRADWPGTSALRAMARVRTLRNAQMRAYREWTPYVPTVADPRDLFEGVCEIWLNRADDTSPRQLCQLLLRPEDHSGMQVLVREHSRVKILMRMEARGLKLHATADAIRANARANARARRDRRVQDENAPLTQTKMTAHFSTATS